MDFPAAANFHASVQTLANPSPFPLGAISFEGIDYTLTGNPIELYGASMAQNAAGLDTISTNLLLGHQLTVGGSGTLEITMSIMTDAAVPTAGATYNGSGTMMLSGSGSQFDNLQISSGTVSIDSGSVRLTNSNSLASTLGVGAANLVIALAGSLDTTAIAPAILAGTAAIPANVTVTGGGSSWSRGVTYVGLNGVGNLVVDQGASSSSTNSLLAGFGGAGSVTVQNGSSLGSGVAQIGIQNDSKVVIDGAGSTWSNDGSMQLGLDGIATLNIANGGAVTVGGITQFSNAAVTITAGKFTSALLSDSGGTIKLTNPVGGTALNNQRRRRGRHLWRRNFRCW